MIKHIYLQFANNPTWFIQSKCL